MGDTTETQHEHNESVEVEDRSVPYMTGELDDADRALRYTSYDRMRAAMDACGDAEEGLFTGSEENEDGDIVAISTCRDIAGDLHMNTVDPTVQVRFKELVYPGRETEEIEDKWIYVFDSRRNRLVFEVYARQSNHWFHRRTADAGPAGEVVDWDTATENGWDETNGTLTLPREENEDADNPEIWCAFLSPLRMTADGIGFLVEQLRSQASHGGAMVPLAMEILGTPMVLEMAPLPDPWRWAVDANQYYYQPRLEAYDEQVFGAEAAAKVFIGTTLKAWCDDEEHGDDIRDQLRCEHQPDAFLDWVKEQEEELRTAADRAAAYVAHCVDSKEYWAIERSALEAGGESLSIALQHWLGASYRMSESRPGKAFLRSILGQRDRLPRRLIFVGDDVERGLRRQGIRSTGARHGERDRVDPDLDWRMIPKGALSAAGLFVEFLPGLPSTGAERMQVYLDQIGFPETEDISMEDLLRQRTGESVPEAERFRTPMLDTVQSGARMFWEDGVREDLEGRPLPEANGNERAMRRAHDWHNSVAEPLGQITFGAGAILTVVNLKLAVDGVRDTDPSVRRDGMARTLLSAGLDSAGLVLDLISQVVRHQLGKRFLATAGAGIGFAGAFLDAVDRVDEISTALDQNNYGQMVGGAIGLAGTTAAVVGMAMTASTSILGTTAATVTVGAWTGPLAVVFAVLGTLVAIGGGIVYALFAQSPYEQFAQFCFLGEGYRELFPRRHAYRTSFGDPRPRIRRLRRDFSWWAIEDFPARRAVDQQRVLLGLLAHFQISAHDLRASDYGNLTDRAPAGFARVDCGHAFPDSWYFVGVELKFQHDYTGHVDTFRAGWSYFLREDRWRRNDRQIRFRPPHAPDRDASGRLSRLQFSLVPTDVTVGAAGLERLRQVVQRAEAHGPSRARRMGPVPDSETMRFEDYRRFVRLVDVKIFAKHNLGRGRNRPQIPVDGFFLEQLVFRPSFQMELPDPTHSLDAGSWRHGQTGLQYALPS